MSKNNDNTEMATTLMMADIDEVLCLHHATRQMVLTAADRLIVSVVAEMTDSGEATQEQAERLCDQVLQTIRGHVVQRIRHPAKEVKS